MKKSLAIYYGLLVSAVLSQAILTVVTLSQNIGYGQKISFLEQQKNTLQIQKNEITKELAQKTAIIELKQKENNDFVAISDVILINQNSSNLALK
ncbi:MAG TPA: hypothetical protein PLQ50_01275 [Candidatus Woesebacteria bacterium]|nr:hypothetical protein [Candidatus Woesebacteria bacterium]